MKKSSIFSIATTFTLMHEGCPAVHFHSAISAHFRTAIDIVGSSDGIVDAMDNFPTRYLLNETAVKKKIPLFHGAIRGLYGQATTIIPGTTPCLRCIFPNAPPQEVFPVVGITPGFIGMIQATEVLKYLLHDGRLLTNRLFLWDGLEAHAEEIIVERNLACPVCGKGKAGTTVRKNK